MLDFGTRVGFSHHLRPRYLEWTKTRSVADPNHAPGAFGFRRMIDVPIDPQLISRGAYTEPLEIGEPLPKDNPVPGSGIHRRLRRFERSGEGVIIGRTWRAEGSYHGAGDEEPAYLSENRRVPVYEIAVQPRPGRYFASYAIIVYPEDVWSL